MIKKETQSIIDLLVADVKKTKLNGYVLSSSEHFDTGWKAMKIPDYALDSAQAFLNWYIEEAKDFSARKGSIQGRNQLRYDFAQMMQEEDEPI